MLKIVVFPKISFILFFEVLSMIHKLDLELNKSAYQMIKLYFSVQQKDIINLYWNVEQKCRKFTKIIGCYIWLNQSMYAAAIVVSVLSMMNRDFDTSKWILPWGVPFDTNDLSIFSWYLLWFSQFGYGFAYSSSTISVATYFVCCCFYIGGLYDHFGFLIESIKNDLELNQSEENDENRHKRIQLIKEKLGKAVCVHAKMYE